MFNKLTTVSAKSFIVNIACIRWQQEEREMASVCTILDVARAERQQGNDFFHQNMFGKAMRKYEKVPLANYIMCIVLYMCVY